MRISHVVAAAAVVLAPSAAFSAAPVYNSTPTAGYFNGTGTNYSPANFAVLSTGGDQLFARFHERVPGPGGSSDLAPASSGNVYNFALGTPGISFDYGVTSSAGVTGLTGNIMVLNYLTGATVNFTPFLPDNAVQGNSTENSENFYFFSGFGYDPNVNNTYSVTLSVNNLASGPQSLTILAQVGSGSGAGPVPEAATWAMMVGGFGMVGGALRRRRTAVRFA